MVPGALQVVYIGLMEGCMHAWTDRAARICGLHKWITTERRVTQ